MRMRLLMIMGGMLMCVGTACAMELDSKRLFVYVTEQKRQKQDMDVVELRMSRGNYHDLRNRIQIVDPRHEALRDLDLIGCRAGLRVLPSLLHFELLVTNITSDMGFIKRATMHVLLSLVLNYIWPRGSSDN